jgi:glyoxylase-like metal-dependent hydrolase (beta-lactamase superfamily II)
MAHANPGIHHIQIGDITVTAMNEGAFQAGTGVLAGIAPADAEQLESAAFRRLPPWITITAFMVTLADGKRALIDTGSGTSFGPAMGGARRRLGVLGVDPASIGTIMITHAHVDHICGMIDEDGKPWFPNAEIVIHEAEVDFWLNPANEATAPEYAKSGFATAQRALGPYRDRIRTVKNGGTGVPGVTNHYLPGHTPGHSGWLIDSAGDQLLLWGDVVHMPAIQFPRPEAAMAFDTDIEQARRSRGRVLALASSERLRVGGVHLDFPPFGHVEEAGSGYRFIPEVWRPEV